MSRERGDIDRAATILATTDRLRFLTPGLHREMISGMRWPGDEPADSGIDVGTLIFDADGEYFWPDRVKGRPGLCDVAHLRDKLVVFTNRQPPSPYYESWKVGGVKLDIRDLRPRDVIGIAVAPERQEQQNVLKLKSLTDASWRTPRFSSNCGMDLRIRASQTATSTSCI